MKHLSAVKPIWYVNIGLTAKTVIMEMLLPGNTLLLPIFLFVAHSILWVIALVKIIKLKNTSVNKLLQLILITVVPVAGPIIMLNSRKAQPSIS